MKHRDEQAIRSYFGQPGFERFLKAIRRQYMASKDGVRGYVTLANITDAESNALDSFYGTYTPPAAGQSRRYSLKKFAQLLKDSRFELSVPELLELLGGEPVLTRREQALRVEAAWRACIESAIESVRAAEPLVPAVARWARGLMAESAPGSRILRVTFVKSPEEAHRCLKLCLMALNRAAARPALRPIRLPVLSATVAGDAHALDWKNPQGRLFWWGLTAIQKQPIAVLSDESELDQADWTDAADPQSAIIREGYRRGGVADDDLSSQAMWYAPELFGVREERVLTLRQVEGLSVERLGKMRYVRIYMVENPSVFAELADADAWEQDETDAGSPVIVCGNGQPSTAVIRLLDTLTSSREGIVLHYAGDLDPAGLGIAQNLQQRYLQAFQPWRMDREHYLRYAHRGMPMTEAERSRLPEGRHEWDTALLAAMRDTGRKLHQEVWLDELMQDLKR